MEGPIRSGGAAVKRSHRAILIAVVGVAAACAAGRYMPAMESGFTFTTPSGTRYISTSRVCFWGILLSSLAISTAVYFRSDGKG